jgi:hypothetical protein
MAPIEVVQLVTSPVYISLINLFGVFMAGVIVGICILAKVPR